MFPQVLYSRCVVESRRFMRPNLVVGQLKTIRSLRSKAGVFLKPAYEGCKGIQDREAFLDSPASRTKYRRSDKRLFVERK